MPELPEIETIVKYLYDKIISQTITDITINCARLRVAVTNDLLKARNNIIVDVLRKGKYIVLPLSNQKNIVIHLGMSGKLLYSQHYIQSKHDHVILHLDKKCIIFNDYRRFGLILLLNDKQLKDFFANSGIEPFSEFFTFQYIYDFLKNRKSNIKTILMNNKFIVGIGNIYASEILFHAKILPTRIASTISNQECQKLLITVRNVLTEAITYGGSTFKDYKKPSGLSGSFQDRFTVYNRGMKSCIMCNNEIKKIKQNNRSTYYCDKCQF